MDLYLGPFFDKYQDTINFTEETGCLIKGTTRTSVFPYKKAAVKLTNVHRGREFPGQCLKVNIFESIKGI